MQKLLAGRMVNSLMCKTGKDLLFVDHYQLQHPPVFPLSFLSKLKKNYNHNQCSVKSLLRSVKHATLQNIPIVILSFPKPPKKACL